MIWLPSSSFLEVPVQPLRAFVPTQGVEIFEVPSTNQEINDLLMDLHVVQ